MPPDCPVKPEGPVVAPDSLVQPRELEFQNPKLVQTPKKVEKLVGKAKHQKPLRFHPKSKIEGGREGAAHKDTKLLLNLDVIKWEISSYKDPTAYHPSSSLLMQKTRARGLKPTL